MLATFDRVNAGAGCASPGDACRAGRSALRAGVGGALAIHLAVSAAALGQPAFLQQRATVLEHATLLHADGGLTEDAMVVLRGEVIEHVGRSIEVEGRATRVDCAGAFITPGLIDVCSGLGMTGTSSGSAASRALDAFDRYDSDSIREAFRNGVTLLYLPATGSSGIVGTGAIVRLAPGETGGWAGQAVEEQAALCINLGSGDSALRRLSTLDAIRRQFKDAKTYRESLETYEEDLKEYEQKIKERAEKQAKEGDKPTEGEKPKEEPKPAEPPKDGAKPGEGEKADEKKDEITKPKKPSPDAGAEIVLKAIDREMKVRIVADRSADILNAIQLAEEFKLDAIIEGGAEAHLVADELAAAKIPVVLGSLLGPGVFQDTPSRRQSDDCAAILTDAGVQWAVGSGARDGMSGRFVLLNAQMLAAHADDVNPLALVTRDAAEFLGVGDRYGRLAPRRAADVVVWTGHPLEAGSRVSRVYVGGRLVYRDEASSSADEGGEQ